MIAIITGDIINAGQHPSQECMADLKSYFSRFGTAPLFWEIYTEDGFQLKVNRDNALKTAIQIKALVRSTKGLDVRMGIGIGLETFVGAGVGESNGPAYQRSGRNFRTLRDKRVNLSMATGNAFQDETLNLMLKLALDFMDHWTAVSAEIVALVLDHGQASQKKVAEKLGIKQSAVSQRLKRARYDLVQELLSYYGDFITKEIPK